MSFRIVKIYPFTLIIDLKLVLSFLRTARGRYLKTTITTTIAIRIIEFFKGKDYGVRVFDGKRVL